MRKFKLKKCYPGSPELGYETNFNNNDEDWSTPNMLIINDCINYPEFWEEINEFPIGTKVLNTWTNTVITRREDGWYKPEEKTAYTDDLVSKSTNLEFITEELIDKNKPKFSVKDVEEALKELKPLYETIHGRIIPGVDVTKCKQKLGI